MGQQLYLYSVA